MEINLQSVMIVVAMVFGTVLTRFLPFWLFPAEKKTPPFLEFLGETLPFATIGLLVVYCLKGIQPLESPHGLPELLAVLLIVIVHRRWNNSLLSIGFGTVFYMILVQVVFK